MLFAKINYSHHFDNCSLPVTEIDCVPPDSIFCW